jgi:putative heme-binding domain-containing protein
MPIKFPIFSRIKVWMRFSLGQAFLFCALVLVMVAQDNENKSDPAKNSVALEALSRLEGMDLEANPGVKAAVLRVLEKTRGTSDFVEIVKKFKLPGQSPGLLDVALKNPSSESGVEAMRMILASGDLALAQSALHGTNAFDAAHAAEALGNLKEKQTIPILLPLVTNLSRAVPVRKAAVRGLAQTSDGADTLLQLARADRLPDDLKFVAGTELNAARWPEVKNAAAKILPLPQGQNAQSLPPLAELLKMKGDVAAGEKVFLREQSACSTCHKVRGRGGEVGPDLTEIGGKLGKDALTEAVLDPSAGISMGFESWHLELKSGDDAYGLLSSDTADEIAIKDSKGIVTRYKKSNVLKREQSKLSIMPAGLQMTMTAQEFVDLIEFLASLKKPSN